MFHRREEIPAQSKVGGIAAKTSLGQLFVQYKCTVMDEINGHYLQLEQARAKKFEQGWLDSAQTRSKSGLGSAGARNNFEFPS